MINPSITAFLKTVMEKDDNATKVIPLTDNAVSKKIYEMNGDIQTQLVEKLHSRYFSLQIDESTLRDNEVILLAYAGYIDKGEFAEATVFCKSIETTTSATDMHMKI